MTNTIHFDKKCLNFKDRRSIVSISENKSTYRLSNYQKLEIECFHVDGCLITEGEKCDYLLIVAERNRNVLIELKGKDVLKAISQIKTTFQRLNRSLNGIFYGRIVTTATYAPAMDSNEAKRLKILLKSTNGNLKIKSSPLEESISTLDQV